MLLGMWDQSAKVLTITRPNGQRFSYSGAAILAGSHKVFGVETVGDEVHVLTGPNTNRSPNRRVIFSDGAVYRGTKGL